jgi:hypothetical protein
LLPKLKYKHCVYADISAFPLKEEGINNQEYLRDITYPCREVGVLAFEATASLYGVVFYFIYRIYKS